MCICSHIYMNTYTYKYTFIYIYVYIYVYSYKCIYIVMPYKGWCHAPHTYVGLMAHVYIGRVTHNIRVYMGHFSLLIAHI